MPYPEELPVDLYNLLPESWQAPARNLGQSLSSLTRRVNPGGEYGGVSGGTGISLADMIPQSKTDIGLTLASMIPAGKLAKLYRGTEARNPLAILREAPEGELGRAIYVTPHQWLAETYGGGPGASVKRGTRLVHEFDVRDLAPEEVAHLRGGSRGDVEAVLMSGAEKELWRGIWSAKKAELDNMRAMNQAAREAGIKMIYGAPDSIALNQAAILDPSIILKKRTLKLKVPKVKPPVSE